MKCQKAYNTERHLLKRVSIRKHNEQHRRLSVSQRPGGNKVSHCQYFRIPARSRDSSSTAQYRYMVPRTEPKRS